MDAIEKRARERLDTELRKLGLHEDAYHVGCGADLDRNDQAAINAIAAALTPPEGYVLVPMVPTKAMVDASVPAASQDQTGRRQRAVWDAMLAARPEVP
ncbi:hypothetical protein AR275_32390 [Stenotrophomonas maltophilia]|nr:hypothetical protein AR275_32390 [Stenotrophomonas maltophilia]